MTTDEAKKKILSQIISAEIVSYMCTYAPDKAVMTISNIIALVDGLTKYRARKALNSLIEDGLIEYTSQGCPAVVSFGEVPELVEDARPPINGYALTKKGFQSNEFKQAYKEWERSLAEWINDGQGED